MTRPIKIFTKWRSWQHIWSSKNYQNRRMVSFYNYLWILSFLKLNFTWFYINHPYGLIIKLKIAINPMLFLDWKWTRPNISGRNVFIQVAVQPRFVLFDQLNVMHPCMQSLHRIHCVVSSDSAFVVQQNGWKSHERWKSFLFVSRWRIYSPSIF